MLRILEKISVLFAWFSLAFILWYFSHYDFSQQTCFVAMENGKVIAKSGICHKRASPHCTFNYVLSLAGYDLDILKDANNPVWVYKPGYEAQFQSSKQDMDPALWRKTSCVWYSQLLADRIGMRNLQRYVDLFDYGNHDLRGDMDQESYMRFWIEGSLEISPYEQAVFLDKMLAQTYPLSEHAYEMTKEIFYNKTFDSGWKLYGKKGSGYRLSIDKKRKLAAQAGWFMGWVEKDARQIVFVAYIEDGNQYYSEYVFNRAYVYALDSLNEIVFNDNH